jgi:hypothetical protein
MQLLDSYLYYLQDQGPPNGGPPPKVATLKACGAEQTDEECPTTARTKKFEKKEAKVGTTEWSPPGVPDLAGSGVQKYMNFMQSPVGQAAHYGGMGLMVGAIAKRAYKKAKCEPFKNNPMKYQNCMKGIKEDISSFVQAHPLRSAYMGGMALLMAKRARQNAKAKKCAPFQNEPEKYKKCMSGI